MCGFSRLPPFIHSAPLCPQITVLTSPLNSCPTCIPAGSAGGRGSIGAVGGAVGAVGLTCV